MATYTTKMTTQLKSIVESKSQDDPNYYDLSIAEKIEIARPLIFNFDYPIWDINHRKELETKIIRHYYMHQIGFEVIGLFIMHLETKLNEIMPYYNQLYETQFSQLDYSPFINYRLHDEYVRNTDGQSSSNSNANSETNSHGKNLYSELPQASLITTADYGTTNNDTQDHNVANAESYDKTNIENLENYVRNVEGLVNKSYTEIVNELRNLILNIDLLIIREFADLFMAVF